MDRDTDLVQFEGHPDAGRHHLPQQVHVGEDPLVPQRGDPEVALEQRVQTVQEKLHTVTHRVGESGGIPGLVIRGNTRLKWMARS